MGAGNVMGALGGGAATALIANKLSGGNTLVSGIAAIAGGVLFAKVGGMIEDKIKQSKLEKTAQEQLTSAEVLTNTGKAATVTAATTKEGQLEV